MMCKRFDEGDLPIDIIIYVFFFFFFSFNGVLRRRDCRAGIYAIRVQLLYYHVGRLGIRVYRKYLSNPAADYPRGSCFTERSFFRGPTFRGYYHYYY